MAELSLELLKKHVRSDDGTYDDDLLGHYLDSARETVLSYSGRTEREIAGMGCSNMFSQAVLMLAAHWYNQRESVSSVNMSQVPDSISVLVKRFQKLSEG